MPARVEALAATSPLPTTDKMDNFQAISLFERGLEPAPTRNDGVIQFHGDTFGLGAKLIDQGGERQSICKLAFFAIKD